MSTNQSTDSLAQNAAQTIMEGVNLTASAIEAGATNTTMNWASEWLGYLALCMFSMVLLVPTLGIVCLMVWEYFSDEAERKAERQKEIDQVMQNHYFKNQNNDSNGRNKEGKIRKDNIFNELDEHESGADDDDDDDDDEDIRDVDEVLKQAETLLHKRHRTNKTDSPDDFDQILT